METDSQLQQDVSAERQWEPSAHAARIGVEVKEGVVTLAGQVDNYSEKWRAGRTVQRVVGVTEPISVAVQGSDDTLSGSAQLERAQHAQELGLGHARRAQCCRHDEPGRLGRPPRHPGRT